METVLKTNAIIKKYGNNTVLNGISMNINKGDIYGFIGKNGAGKTTFMRVVLSLTTKTSGEVEFFDGKKEIQDAAKVSLLLAKYAFVDATAISGPASVYITSSVVIAIELSLTFTIPKVWQPCFLAFLIHARVSAVSPDWDIAMTNVLLSTKFFW